MDATWYLIRSKPQKEFLLHSQLLARNLTCYFPRVEVNPINPRAAKVKAYFPSYMFIQCNIDELGINTFKWMPYSQGLVCFDGIPAIVPDRIIAELEKHIGHIYHEAQRSIKGIKPGTPVIVTDGPFEGYQGIFDYRLSDKERVRVLLKLLDKKHIPININVNQIQAY